jgi:putative transposase
MKRSFKYRLYPNFKQQKVLFEIFGFCRFLYNSALEERISYYKKEKRSVVYKTQVSYLPEIKSIFGLETKNIIHSQTLQSVLKQLDNAFGSFFRRVAKKSNKVGFPRFKNSDRFKSICFPQVSKDLSGTCIKLSDDKKKVRIFGLGDIKIKYHRPIQGIAKQCRIIKQSDLFYLVVSCDKVPEVLLPKTGKSVGMDLGLISFAVLSDETEFHHPKPYKTSSEKLAHRQRKLAMKQRGSKNRRKQKTLVAKAHQKIFDIRNDWQHKVANQIVKNYDIICAEKLNIKNMLESKGFEVSKKNIADASWGSFLQKLQYKAESAGKEVRSVDPAYTSRTCSRCGHVNDHMSLKDRMFHCEHCGFAIKRDLNSAIEIKKIGLGTSPAITKVVSEAPL